MKRTKFEELVDSDFRWPTQGDVPFTVDENPSENASISTDPFSRFVFMTEGYKRAADLMIDRASDRHERDYLVCPIIFNYRQYVELSLKYIIATYGDTVGVGPIWNDHDLTNLWSAHEQVLERYGTTDPDDADPIVAGIVAEFAKIDPRSYSYRYPVNTKGVPVPLAYTDLHLPTLRDVMQGVDGYFTGCDGYLADLQRSLY